MEESGVRSASVYLTTSPAHLEIVETKNGADGANGGHSRELGGRDCHDTPTSQHGLYQGIAEYDRAKPCRRQPIGPMAFQEASKKSQDSCHQMAGIDLASYLVLGGGYAPPTNIVGFNLPFSLGTRECADSHSLFFLKHSSLALAVSSSVYR